LGDRKTTGGGFHSTWREKKAETNLNRRVGDLKKELGGKKKKRERVHPTGEHSWGFGWPLK